MKTLILALTLLLGATVAAAAQEPRPPDSPFPTPTSQGATGDAAVVSVGRVDWEVAPDEIAQICVAARDEDLDGATLTVLVLIRTTEAWLALPTYETAATGAVADARAGQCFLLDPEATN